jgi:hypothetical protein
MIVVEVGYAHVIIIYSIFKKTIGCHALILLNWQY